MRALFFGTPEIAVPSLLGLLEVAEIVGVVCQPDRPAARGLKLQEPPVKRISLEHGLPILQPEKVRSGELEAWVRERNADVAVVIAYGRILPLSVLQAPRCGSVNLHASLLPRYRGAAPIQRALMAGEKETGVCLMQMDEGMDTGPILSTHVLPILPEDDAGSLAVRLGELARVVTQQDVPRFVAGELTPQPQDHQLASYAAPILKEEGWLRFAENDASQLSHSIRGLSPRPGAYSFLHEKRVRIQKARPVLTGHPASTWEHLKPGEIGIAENRLFVGCAQSTVLEILEVQLEGKKMLPARDALNGRFFQAGDSFSSPGLP